MKILTIGTFSELHEGHRAFFDKFQILATQYLKADTIIGVNADNSSALTKQGKVPTQDEPTRREAVARECDWFATVVTSGGSGRALIENSAPCLIVIGSDWHENGYLAQLGVTQAELDAWGVSVCYVPRHPGISSSQLREERHGTAQAVDPEG